MSDFFKLQEHGTSVGREIMAGATTFAAMAYPRRQSADHGQYAGIDQGASFVATCLAAALSCFLMGLYANWPVGLAPGMGLNALFAYTIVGDMGYPWQTALGAVFIAGVLFVIISTTRIRAWIIMSIPDDLKIGMTAGVGLFIGIIGLQNGGIIADHRPRLSPWVLQSNTSSARRAELFTRCHFVGAIGSRRSGSRYFRRHRAGYFIGRGDLSGHRFHSSIDSTACRSN